ncbi:MAG TPA: hypothetical protein ENL24_00020 [candidate division Zixibacteria bacterium]|nr:hypothetical protein [candidate division Zixibacteria bacterium]
MLTIIGKIRYPEQTFGRIIIKGNKVVELDDSHELPENSDVLELGEKVLIPALTDCHVHFFQTGLYLGALNLGDMRIKAELIQKLRSTDPTKNLIGEILWGYDYDPIDSMPTADELTDIFGDIPVVIRRADGHSCSLSHAAMKLLPGRLRNENGIYLGKSNELVIEHLFTLLDEETLKDAAKKVSDFAVKAGALFVHALVPNIRWAKVLMAIEDSLPIKLTIFVETTDVASVAELGLKQIGGCILLDGSFGSRTAALSKPYADAPENRGILYFLDDRLYQFFMDARAKGLRVAMHAIGDAAIEQYLRVAEKVSGGAPLHGWRIEHAELAHGELLERIARLSLTLSVQPAFEARWGGPNGMYAKRLGDRWRQTNQFRRARELGINLIGGSDSYITPIDPVGGIVAALAHPNDEQKLEFSEAMEMFSDAPARWEGRKPPLRKGSEALGIILDSDFGETEKPKVMGVVRGERVEWVY